MKNIFKRFSTLDWVFIAMFISLLYISAIPFKIGLSKIPIIQPFVFSIPYMAVLVIAARTIPKPGSVGMIIFGQMILSQATSSGINPLWWPHALIQIFALESYFFLTKNYCRTPANAVFAGILRGAVSYLCFYMIEAPFIWHKFYAVWYISFNTAEGIIGSAFGAWIGYKAGISIEKGYKSGRL